MIRPIATPDLLATLRSAAPPRAVAKLDANPGAADAWTWGDRVVTSEGGERVTIAGEQVGAGDLTCTCLLSPRCFHVLAVAAALPTTAPALTPTRRTAAPGLLAALRAAAPPRAVAKLDAAPDAAAGWTWAGATVATEAGETVTIGGEGAVTQADLACTCLLSPRCFHILAVARALAEPTPTTAPIAGAVAVAVALEPTVEIGADQRKAAEEAWIAALTLLAGGANAAGESTQDALLRAIHSCRASGLHRAAQAGLRTVRQVRHLHRQKPTFALAELADELGELLLVSRALRTAGPVPKRWLGVGRRTYEAVGSLRLFGLFTEPVVAATGYAGVSTVLCDASGGLWSVGDVMPGGPSRARGAYDAGAAIGGVSLPHRALGRQGLFVQGATASDDRRLGSGAGVSAVRSGASAWDDPAPDRLFTTPLREQLVRSETGSDLLFLRVTVLGAGDEGLWVATPEARGPICCVPPTDHAELAYRENLRWLARSPGLALRLVGRPVPGRPRTLTALAAGQDGPPAQDRPALNLPPEWGGRCNLGLDALASQHLPGAAARPLEILATHDPTPDPLEAVRRRVRRVALGGRGTLPPEARQLVDRDVVRLRSQLQPTAAACLDRLAETALGAREPARWPALADAWLAAWTADRVGTRTILRAAWTARDQT